MRHERRNHGEHRGGHESKVRIDGAVGDLQPITPAALDRDRHGDDSERDEGQGHEERAASNEVVHAPAPLMSVFAAFSGDSPGFGGRYSFECLTMRLVELNTPFGRYRPSTTTPMPSRNICGGAPCDATATSDVPSVTVKR